MHIAYGNALSTPFVIYNKGTAALPLALLYGHSSTVGMHAPRDEANAMTITVRVPIAHNHLAVNIANIEFLLIVGPPI